MRKPLIATIAVLAATAVAPGIAPAASSKDIARDCADNGTIEGTYTSAELAKALDDLSSDAAQYTDCAAAISTAQGDAAAKNRRRGASGGAGPSGGGTGGSGAFTTTPDLGGGGARGYDGQGSTDPLSTASQQDRDAIDTAVKDDGRDRPTAADVKLPEANVSLRQARASSELPVAVVVALAAAVITAGIGAALALLAFVKRRSAA